ncbi:hypothetical protein GQ42DRAFT_172926 [Ramicandelaber brevisporus]|nr:hypothetical protein GQ42DRAFT_172926 [Ramicandelaber brevisporus]
MKHAMPMPMSIQCALALMLAMMLPFGMAGSGNGNDNSNGSGSSNSNSGMTSLTPRYGSRELESLSSELNIVAEVLAIVFCSFSILASLYVLGQYALLRRYLPLAAAKFTVSYTAMICFLDIFYSIALLVSYTIKHRTPWCRGSVFFIVYLCQLSMYLRAVMAMRFQLLIVYKASDARTKFITRGFMVGCTMFALVIALLPFFWDLYGFEPAGNAYCWYRQEGSWLSLKMQWATYYIWLVLIEVYCIIAIAQVFRQVSKEEREIHNLVQGDGGRGSVSSTADNSNQDGPLSQPASAPSALAAVVSPRIGVRAGNGSLSATTGHSGSEGSSSFGRILSAQLRTHQLLQSSSNVAPAITVTNHSTTSLDDDHSIPLNTLSVNQTETRRPSAISRFSVSSERPRRPSCTWADNVQGSGLGAAAIITTASQGLMTAIVFYYDPEIVRARRKVNEYLINRYFYIDSEYIAIHPLDTGNKTAAATSASPAKTTSGTTAVASGNDMVPNDAHAIVVNSDDASMPTQGDLAAYRPTTLHDETTDWPSEQSIAPISTITPVSATDYAVLPDPFSNAAPPSVRRHRTHQLATSISTTSVAAAAAAAANIRRINGHVAVSNALSPRSSSGNLSHGPMTPHKMVESRIRLPSRQMTLADAFKGTYQPSFEVYKTPVFECITEAADADAQHIDNDFEVNISMQPIINPHRSRCSSAATATDPSIHSTPLSSSLAAVAAFPLSIPRSNSISIGKLSHSSTNSSGSGDDAIRAHEPFRGLSRLGAMQLRPAWKSTQAPVDSAASQQQQQQQPQALRLRQSATAQPSPIYDSMTGGGGGGDRDHDSIQEVTVPIGLSKSQSTPNLVEQFELESPVAIRVTDMQLPAAEQLDASNDTPTHIQQHIAGESYIEVESQPVVRLRNSLFAKFMRWLLEFTLSDDYFERLGSGTIVGAKSNSGNQLWYRNSARSGRRGTVRPELVSHDILSGDIMRYCRIMPEGRTSH